MFEENILNIYGNTGKIWLEGLQEMTLKLSRRLDLHGLQPVSNLSYNYVASGFQGNTPIILKLSLDHQGLEREAFALACFRGYGAVDVMEKGPGWLLLEKAVPGISLKSYFPGKEIEAIHITCDVIKKLQLSPPLLTHDFPHIHDWLSALDRGVDIPGIYLQKAKELYDMMLGSCGPDLLLHGDLHPDNILQKGNDWVVIDPKGVIGEPSFEVAAFIYNPIPDLLIQENPHHIIQTRIDIFSKELNMPAQRIKAWCFIRVVLAWVWAMEDHCDTKYWEGMTALLDELLHIKNGG